MSEPRSEHRPLRRVHLREEWFTDADGHQHNRVVDAEDGAVFCDFDNETWPCSAAAHIGSDIGGSDG